MDSWRHQVDCYRLLVFRVITVLARYFTKGVGDIEFCISVIKGSAN